MQEIYIISAVRTPIGRFGGVLADLSPVDLGVIAIQAAVERAKVPAVSFRGIYIWQCSESRTWAIITSSSSFQDRDSRECEWICSRHGVFIGNDEYN